MNLKSLKWKNKWSKKSRDKLFDYDIVKTRIWGSDVEPASSIWLASLSEGLGDHFTEGITILDYGCGGGRYLNFVHERLHNYRYFGLDIEGGGTESTIKELSKFFKDTENVEFGFVNTKLEGAAIKEADVVILGSVFTHLKFNKFIEISDKLMPVLEKGGAISFSVFLRDKEEVEGKSLYGQDCYQKSYYTLEQLNSYFEEKNKKLTEVEFFVAQRDNRHRIFRAENNG